MCGDLKPFAHFKREREHARGIHSHRLWHCVSQNLFKLLYNLFNEEIWIVQYYNYFTSTGQRKKVQLHVLSILSRHLHDQLDIVFLRLAFLETADQTSPSDYQPIVIGNRSIGAPLAKTTEKMLLKSQDACPLTQESSEIKKLQQADVNKLNFVLPSSDITEIHLNMCNP